METFRSYNPATGEVIGVFPNASASEVACTVERAGQSAVGWAGLNVEERCAGLRKLHGLVAKDADRLAALISEEIGKPLQEAYGAELLPTLSSLEWLVRYAPRLLRERKIEGRRGAAMSPVPFGIVGVIGTWNYPVSLNLTTIAWALAAGNVVVWKPSELATKVAVDVARLSKQAGLPVRVVTGEGATGRALCRAGCDKIAFTGGVATGRAILAELAERGTPSVMELSGKDAMLVCADAEVEVAARSAVWGRVSNAGQSCVSPQRIYVAREVYERFLAACLREMEGLRPGVDYGPIRTDAMRCHAHLIVRDAVSRGAKLLIGGRCLQERPGFYYAPTLLSGCSEDMQLMEEDYFGPVLAVSPVTSDAEGVALANRSDLALGASVWTRNLRRGREIAGQLKVGLVTINDVLLDAADPELPFGGFGGSGFGKQRGQLGLEEFTQWRVVVGHGPGGARRHLFPYRTATLPLLRSMIALKAGKGVGAKWAALRELGRAGMRWMREERQKSQE